MTNASAPVSREMDADGFTRADLGVAASSSMSQHAAIMLVTQGKHVIYALRLPDGVIKIGCSRDLPNRMYTLRGELLGFKLGGFDDERVIHQSLRPFRSHGYEYYNPKSQQVWAVVNDLRDSMGLPHLTA